ncbi:hypothetical protein SAMN05660477_00393 [Soonwooa buanensis]|uniref:Uncharacterized protein n=1 Tax=Soonwooa buanensis TaxID=619805 RepID=A0A1T5CVI0_9FLAO|nr:hypothetical protein [Soonwooa buanensis]SKB63505.1 hypothetical protein SAMN05660477_00393 [Soonwooa buanensis]
MANIKEKVKSFEDACSVLGIQPTTPDFSFLEEKEQKAHEAHFKLVIIAKALNEGWTPNWTNGKSDKWFLWFDFNTDNEKGSSSSGRFSFDGSVLQRSYSDCGSRLCFKSSELADYAAEQFFDLYRDYYVIED